MWSISLHPRVAVSGALDMETASTDTTRPVDVIIACKRGAYYQSRQASLDRLMESWRGRYMKISAGLIDFPF